MIQVRIRHRYNDEYVKMLFSMFEEGVDILFSVCAYFCLLKTMDMYYIYNSLKDLFKKIFNACTRMCVRLLSEKPTQDGARSVRNSL